MNIHKVYGVFQRFFRKKRMRIFERLFCITNDTIILDVGGDQFNWQFLDHRPRVTVINLSKPTDWDDALSYTQFEQGDGTNLPYSSKSVDVSYSNSVIEHLGDWNSQRRFADEIMRVGKSIYVQTPAREFFIEPHLITPFIHWLPVEWQSKLMRNFTVWGLITRPSQKYIDEFLRERRLLTLEEFKDLFAGCEIIRERWLLFTKSYIAFRKPD